jgi:putative ABC transport system ATP-binding protein
MLVAEGIGLSFTDSGGQSFKVLDIPSFIPEPGKLTTVSGPSGSGKSTLLYVLAGLLPPQQGTVLHDGTNIYKMKERRRDAWRRTRIGFIFQDFHLVSDLSPLGNAALGATFGAAPGVRERARSVLAELGVPAARRSIDYLSRGERQRVAIARALAFDPPIILADEPSASLDCATTVELLTVLKRLAGEGRTVVVATHDPDILAQANMRFHLEHGRLSEASRMAAE